MDDCGEALGIINYHKGRSANKRRKDFFKKRRKEGWAGEEDATKAKIRSGNAKLGHTNHRRRL